MSSRLQSRPIPRAMRGIGLIEVLVSVLILGVGLLGIAAMQSLALRGGQSSLESSQAVMQATSIAEAMRSNRENAGSYQLGLCAAPAAAGLAGADMTAWVASLKSTIGNAADTCGAISGCPNACVITVQWNDTRAGGGATRTITTRARI